MSDLKSASPALTFCSVLYRSELWDQSKLLIFIESLGIQNDFLFVHDHPSMNEYYSKEMAGELKRFFVFDSRPAPREDLIELKVRADQLERKYSALEKREFNLDIGIVTMEQMVLATGKPYSHRPYLGRGVYAELTYHWEKGAWKTFPWTYPDYANEAARSHFELVRSMLKEQLSP